jgi:hypothetical protein
MPLFVVPARARGAMVSLGLAVGAAAAGCLWARERDRLVGGGVVSVWRGVGGLHHRVVVLGGRAVLVG